MAIRLLGLTGGIATGKSTVSQQLADKGVEILCADKIYHDLIAPIDSQPSPLALSINDAFEGVLRKNGALNRPELGKRVFGNPSQLQKLGSLTHPAVALEVQHRIQALEKQGIELVIYDVPLLFERNLEALFEGILVVWVPKSVQLQRLIQRDGISVEAATKRLESQLPIDLKKEKATWVLDNSKSPQETTRQLDSLWNHIVHQQ